MRLSDGSNVRDDVGDAAQPPANWIHGRVADRLHAATCKALGYSIGGKANTNQDGSIAKTALKPINPWAGALGWLKDAAKNVLGFADGGEAPATFDRVPPTAKAAEIFDRLTQYRKHGGTSVKYSQPEMTAQQSGFLSRHFPTIAKKLASNVDTWVTGFARGGLLDVVQSSLDATGAVDPTGIADGVNAGVSLVRGVFDKPRRKEHLANAGISALSAIPGGIGDVAKLLKTRQYGRALDHLADGFGGNAASVPTSTPMATPTIGFADGGTMPQPEAIRSDAFKNWFGPWESVAELGSLREVRGSDQVSAATKIFKNQPLINRDSGVEASVSGRTLGKMGSDSSWKNSVSRLAHMHAVANLDKLFRSSILRLSRPPRKESDVGEIREMHHFDVPMPFEGDVLRAKMLAKEHIDPKKGTRIYNVSSVQVTDDTDDKEKNLASKRADQSETSPIPPARFQEKFDRLLAAVKGDSSKIVGKDGSPLRVFHGTNKTFDTFDASKSAGPDRAIHFTTDANYASGYATSFTEKSGRQAPEGANIVPAYLSIKNPAFALVKQSPFDETAIQTLREKGHDGLVVGMTADEYADGHRNIEDHAEEIIPFQNTQIKSTFNRGTYSPNDPRIGYASGGNIVQRGLRAAASVCRAVDPIGFAAGGIARGAQKLFQWNAARQVTHSIDDSNGVEASAASVSDLIPPWTISADQFASAAIPADESAELVARIRAGDSTSKNEGRYSGPEQRTPSLVETQLPVSFFANEWRKTLSESTDPLRVAKYAGTDPRNLPPIYALPNTSKQETGLPTITETSTSESVLDRIKQSPNQPQDRNWSQYANAFGVEGDFHHTELSVETLAANMAGGQLRTSTRINQDDVTAKVETGARNPVVITKEPGRSFVVVDGTHSLHAAIQAGDKTVKGIVSEKASAFLPKTSKRDDDGGHKGWFTSDGGHRLLAAIQRGDETVKALVPADSHAAIVESAIQAGHYAPGYTHTLPADDKTGRMAIDAKIFGMGGGKASIGWAGGDGPLTNMPIESLPHFFADLSGKVNLPPTSGNPVIDSIVAGKGDYLGKGHDGVVFGVGDKVAKVSSTVPYQPFNPGHRTPQEAKDLLRAEVERNNKLFVQLGGKGILPQEYREHGDKAFAIRDRLDIPEDGKFTAKQVQRVRHTMDAMHDAGHVLGDTVQVGLKGDKPYLYDLGQARDVSDNPPTWQKDYFDDDSSAFERFAKSAGHPDLARPLAKTAANRFATGIESVQAVKDDPEDLDFHRARHGEWLTTAAEGLKLSGRFTDQNAAAYQQAENVGLTSPQGFATGGVVPAKFTEWSDVLHAFASKAHREEGNVNGETEESQQWNEPASADDLTRIAKEGFDRFSDGSVDTLKEAIRWSAQDHHARGWEREESRQTDIRDADYDAIQGKQYALAQLIEKTIPGASFRESGGGSKYATLNRKNDLPIKIRIADHHQVEGGGFNEGSQSRSGESDISWVVDSPLTELPSADEIYRTVLDKMHQMDRVTNYDADTHSTNLSLPEAPLHNLDVPLRIDTQEQQRIAEIEQRQRANKESELNRKRIGSLLSIAGGKDRQSPAWKAFFKARPTSFHAADISQLDGVEKLLEAAMAETSQGFARGGQARNPDGTYASDVGTPPVPVAGQSAIGRLVKRIGNFAKRTASNIGSLAMRMMESEVGVGAAGFATGGEITRAPISSVSPFFAEQSQLPGFIHPATLKPEQFFKASELDASLRANYFDAHGNRKAESSRTTPVASLPDVPVGSWRTEDRYGGNYGHDLSQLTWLDPHQLEVSEHEIGSAWGRDRREDAERYAGWMREGRQAPPIEVVETDSGKLKVSDGHRRHHAAKLAGQHILAWVSPNADTGGRTPLGQPITTALTDRLAKQDLENLSQGFAGGGAVGNNETHQPAIHSDAFKGWFGDWEKSQTQAEYRRFLEGEPIVKLKGDEVPKFDKTKDLAKWVGDWFASEHGGKATHPVIGDVILDERGAKHSVSHGLSKTKAMAFAAVPEIVAKGQIVSSTSGRKGRKMDEHVIAAPVELQGIPHVGIGIARSDVNGQRFYLHEAIETKKLRESSKTGASAFAEGVPERKPGAIQTVLRDILSVNESSSSKIIDKDGSPLKVFHGTDRDVEQFDVFGGNDFGSHFGTVEQANDRASRSDGQVIPAYLSAKNPLRLPDLGRWDYDTMQPELAKHGINVPKVEYRIETADRAENYGRMIRRQNETIGQAITQAGYDGIVYQNSHEGQEHTPADSYIVWNPTQIKSTFNRGTWSNDDARIGYAAGGDVVRGDEPKGFATGGQSPASRNPAGLSLSSEPGITPGAGGRVKSSGVALDSQSLPSSGFATGGIQALLTPDEVVVNPVQQAALGQMFGASPAKVFQQAGVPGFADGGGSGSAGGGSDPRHTPGPSDTVLGTLLAGDVVLNKAQQGRLESLAGGTPAAKLFGMAGVPGFAGGGGPSPFGQHGIITHNGGIELDDPTFGQAAPAPASPTPPTPLTPPTRNLYRELLDIDTEGKPSPHELIGSQPGQFDKAEYQRRVQHVKGYASHDNWKHQAAELLNEMAAARAAIESPASKFASAAVPSAVETKSPPTPFVGLVDPHPEVGSFGKPAGTSGAPASPTKLGPDVDWNSLTPDEQKNLQRDFPSFAKEIEQKAAVASRQPVGSNTTPSAVSRKPTLAGRVKRWTGGDSIPTFASQATPTAVSAPAPAAVTSPAEVLPTLEHDPNGTDVIPTLKPADPPAPRKWTTTGKNADGSDSGLGQQPINGLPGDTATPTRGGKQQSRHPLVDAVLSMIPGHVGRAARSAWSAVGKGSGASNTATSAASSGGPPGGSSGSGGGGSPPIPPSPGSPPNSPTPPGDSGLPPTSTLPPTPAGAATPGKGVIHVWVDGGQINVANWPGASVAAAGTTGGTSSTATASSPAASPTTATTSRRRPGGRSPTSSRRSPRRESLNDSLTGRAVRNAFRGIAKTKLGKQLFASKLGQTAGKAISGLARTAAGRVTLNSTIGTIVGGGAGGTLGGAATAIMGGGLGGGVAGIASKLGPPGMVVAAAALFVSKLNDAANALRGFAQQTAESNRSLATYNGAIAGAFAKLDSQRIRREKEVGAFTSGSNRALTKAVNEAEEARQPLRALGMQTDNILGALGAKISTGIDTIILRLAAVGQLFKIVALIESWLPKSKDSGFSPAERMMADALGFDPGGQIKQAQQGRAANIDKQVKQAEKDGIGMLLNMWKPGAGDAFNLLFNNQKEAEAGKKPFNPPGRNR